MQFELLNNDGLARRGRLHLHHGVVETPIFMPVGTYGSVYLPIIVQSSYQTYFKFFCKYYRN